MTFDSDNPSRTLSFLCPIGMLGYGVEQSELDEAQKLGFDVIIVDSGSTDPGPYLLGLEQSITPMPLIKRDIQKLIHAARTQNAKLIISSCGGPGINSHLAEIRDFVCEQAKALGYSPKIAAIHQTIEKSTIKELLSAAKIENMEGAPTLTEAAIDAATNIVAQLGQTPFIKALESEADIILSSRAYDPAPYAAFAHYMGFNSDAAWHMGKVLECGGVCAEPKSKGIIGRLDDKGFELVPLDKHAACTPTSVAAHSFYETADPLVLAGPDGDIDLTCATYEALDARCVRVEGSTHRSKSHSLKIEGARVVGHRAMFIGGVTDPIFISFLPKLNKLVHHYMRENFDEIMSDKARIDIKQYGCNGVSAFNTEVASTNHHELGLLVEVTAENKEIAMRLCAAARIAILHAPYPGQKATGGNIALPHSPSEVDLGPVCEFSVYHIIKDCPQDSFFNLEILDA
ncbi:acyclic terpene utilization AtuA family protein [Glaciecola siphonariae]|uniref:Acyclic terpene utilization AtuA family protein n=1 Tax=Glaciecola siphonariae TaxID=521012 RepID=A0ABV9LS23_9ALTE